MKETDNDIIVLIDHARAIEAIAGSVAHEVRNPMAVVSGSLKVLEWKEDLAPYVPQFRSMIREIDRAVGLLGEFIRITRPKEFELRPGNLNMIVESIQELLSAEALVQRHGIIYELGLIDDVLVDSQRFCQVIINLVRNALEAMSPPPKTVTVKTCMEGDKICFAVIDQGNGFAQEILDNWGKPYQTTKTQGSGLGLAACKYIVENHKAHMEIFSSEHGSTVKILFAPLDTGQWLREQGMLASL